MKREHWRILELKEETIKSQSSPSETIGHSYRVTWLKSLLVYKVISQKESVKLEVFTT